MCTCVCVCTCVRVCVRARAYRMCMYVRLGGVKWGILYVRQFGYCIFSDSFVVFVFSVHFINIFFNQIGFHKLVNIPVMEIGNKLQKETHAKTNIGHQIPGCVCQ